MRKSKLLIAVIAIAALALTAFGCGEPTLEKIELTETPTITSFVGSELAISGGKLKATYSDDKTETVNVTKDMISGFDKTKAGEQTLTITYEGKTTTFKASAKAVEISSLTVKTAPEKDEYYAGQSFDPSGLVLKAVYNNGVEKEILGTAAGVTFDKTGALAAADTKIKATYEGKTVEIPVTVKASVEAKSLAELKQKLAAAKAGDGIMVSGTIAVTETLTIDKAVTVFGAAGQKFTISGDIAAFQMQFGGGTLENLTIEKTDKTGVAGLVMLGEGATVRGCKFTGKYALGDNEVVRGIVQYAGTTVTIENNEFSALRQPAYLEGAGNVRNNKVEGTRGFVVTGTSTIVFEGNSFADNAVDIAIIKADASSTVNHYKDKAEEISSKNNDCYVQNQISNEEANKPE